jgi:uncharacterized repeat protein (TIGR01451 family)
MHRLLSLIPAFRPSRNSGKPAGMRERSVSTIHVSEYTGRAAGCCERQPAVSNETASPPPSRSRFSRSIFALCVSLLMLALPLAAFAATPPGTQIDNSATATFNSTDSATSNLVSITTVVQRTPSTITFLQYAPTNPPGSQTVLVPATAYSTTGDLTSPAPFQPVGPSGLPDPLPLIEAQAYHAGLPFYISLEDQDQNIDPSVRETVLVRISCLETGDDELLLLTEDDIDSGVFLGYVLSESGNQVLRNGTLAVLPNCTLDVYYVDTGDSQDESLDDILIDPYGFVFDSASGAPIDGAQVSLFDVTAGQPATVFYDDGSPGYPSTVTTGDISFGFPAGGYRFPLIQPGRTYRLDVLPPAGYGMPSQVPPDVLRNQFGSQYAIDDQASFAGDFPINPGPIIRVDIPADPSTSGLWLTKEAIRSVVAIGDFLQYTLTLENLSSSGIATDVTIEDHLPTGFRYQKGSFEINGRKAINPIISSDGLTLRMALGDLPAGQSVTVTYVVEVAAGAKTGDAINRAIAHDVIGTTSNLATASVIVRDDFFRNETFILGRVMIGSCETLDTEKEGLANARIYLEDGSYVITDSDGKYHYEGVEPGVHVVQLDLDTVPSAYEVLPCEDNSQFAGRSFSQFVDLKSGTLWRADFYVDLKPKPRGEVRIELSGSLSDQLATFRVPIHLGGVTLENLRLSVILPQGLTYQTGQSTLNGQTTPDPDARGPVLTYRLGSQQAGWQGEVILQTQVSIDGIGELPTKAVLTFDAPGQKNQRTPMAENLLLAKVDESRTPITRFEVRPNYPIFVADLSVADKSFFDQLAEQLQDYKINRLYAIGHTDNAQIAPRSRNIFADNYVLSSARAKSVARYLGEKLNLTPAEIVVTGMADKEPVADNATEAGRSMNRRVEIRIEGEKIDRDLILDLVKAHSGPQSAETVGTQPGAESLASINSELSEEAPEYDETWLAQAEPGLEWLWPTEGSVPEIPSIKVVIKHLPGQKLTLTQDGEAVSPLSFEGTLVNSAGTVALTQWRGIGIQDGDNQFELQVTDAQGQTVNRITQTVHYSYAPAFAEFLPEQSLLLADGRTPPVIAVRFTDRDGYPISAGMFGEFGVTPPYGPYFDISETDTTLTEQGRPKFRIEADGIARIRLAPTPQSGEVLLTLPLEDDLAEISAWLKPASRDWVLVGFAEGTAGYNTFSGNQVSLDEAGIDEHFYDDGQVKFFAKGAIKGEWLLTMAYDSDKPDLDGDSLYQVIDPDTYYPLYGDGTNQGYEASSADKLFLKLERDQFYALFGDMNTGLTQTELSRYDRNMSGFKSEMQTYNFSYTMFAADTKQAFVKDEIRGDGTSGRYYLTQKDLVINSEEVIIETRDRFRSEVITDTRTLQRHTDYDINYDNGSLFFKRPVASKDKNFNPVFIVVRYETLDSDDENFNYGGRAAVKVLDQKVEIGASYVHEERGAGEGDLYGVDATVKLTPQTRLHLEAARTENEFFDGDETDDAYLAEISHDDNRIRTRAYYREQGNKFGLGQQNLSESGTRKYGTEASYHFTPKFSVAGLAYREHVMANGNDRDVAELDARYQAERYGLNSGFRHAEDRLGDGKTKRSEQLLAGANWFSADTRLKLRADHEQSLNGMNKNVDFPTRSIMGLDYQINQRISIFAEQEFTWGKEENTEGTRVGFNATPWHGGDVHTTVERQMNENSQRVFAIFGLGQTWRINETWSVDASLDRSYTLKSSQDDYQFNDNVPTAQGSDDDFTSVSVGSTYRKAKWTWWNRLETRQADNEDKYGVSTSVVGEPKDGVAVSAKALAFISEVSGGARHTDGNIRLGAAYRPSSSRWILLNRLDFYFDKMDDSNSDYDNWRIVNNLHANFRLNRKLQMSFYYGLKYVRDNYDGRTYSGYTDLIAFETRYNITKRWDIGLHGSILHSWNSNNFGYSAGADVGYSPITNTWVSLGYNVVGFEDDDFTAAHYSAQGAYMRIRAKFDQQSVKDAAKWINR